MEKQISLVVPRVPKIVADLTHSLEILKFFSLASLVVAALSLSSALYLANRPTKVLTLAPDATLLSPVKAPKPEDEIQAAVDKYVSLRYVWEPSTVTDHIEAARAFVLPVSLKAFDAAVKKTIVFSTSKQVAQHMYPKIKVDIKHGLAVLTGDRIAIIQGVYAAAPNNLELQFQSGPRTDANPWGVYISKETER